MRKRFFYILHFIWLSGLIAMTLSAQESDLYNRMLGETFHSQIPMDLTLDFSDSIFINKPLQLDATKQFLPHLGFNYKLNKLLLFNLNNSAFPSPKKISPNLMTFSLNKKNFYLNIDPPLKNTPVVFKDPSQRFNSFMINPLVIVGFLMQAGIIPDHPYVPKKSKKERMLKTIVKDVYHIDDY
jgi:hypothetical protein